MTSTSAKASRPQIEFWEVEGVVSCVLIDPFHPARLSAGKDNPMPRINEGGVYATCDACGNQIFEHMEQNKEIFDATGFCGVCATGETDVYFSEL